MEQLEAEYPDHVALDTQPEWMTDLMDAHPSIELAFVRERGATPAPKVELNVTNSISRDAGWHRIEALEDGWFYHSDTPPAGVESGLQWLRENREVSEFREWFEEHR